MCTARTEKSAPSSSWGYGTWQEEVPQAFELPCKKLPRDNQRAAFKKLRDVASNAVNVQPDTNDVGLWQQFLQSGARKKATADAQQRQEL